MAKSKIIGIIAIKGGVGKTTVVSNLGAVLANAFDKRVLVVDANFSAPNLGIHLGVAKPTQTIHDVLFDSLPIRDAIQNTQFGFDLLPGALNPKTPHQRRINPYKLNNRLEEVRSDYDYILIDSSPNLNDEIMSTIISSDELFVVTSPDYPTLSCTLRAVRAAEERRTPISGLILNKVRGKKFELSTKEIGSCTSIPVVSVMKDDIKILESLSKTQPAYLAAPKRPVMDEYRRLGTLLTGEAMSNPGFISRLFN